PFMGGTQGISAGKCNILEPVSASETTGLETRMKVLSLTNVNPPRARALLFDSEQPRPQARRPARSRRMRRTDALAESRRLLLLRAGRAPRRSEWRAAPDCPCWNARRLRRVADDSMDSPEAAPWDGHARRSARPGQPPWLDLPPPRRNGALGSGSPCR